MTAEAAFPIDIFMEQFAEIYEGVPAGRPTWDVGDGTDASVFGSIDALTAEQASARPCGSLTIAAHTEHLRWSLAYAHAYFEGEAPDVRWSGSWSVDTVDDEAWRSLRTALRERYAELRRAIEAHDDGSVRDLRAGTLALVPRGAYHLGAIRLLRKAVLDD